MTRRSQVFFSPGFGPGVYRFEIKTPQYMMQNPMDDRVAPGHDR
jgi:hypothetical protein